MVTNEELVYELEAERDWRVAELGKIKRLCRKIKDLDADEFEKLYLKMTIPMIYAHWEGYCVASFKILMEYINRKQIDARSVTFNILTYANNVTYNSLQGKSSFPQRVEFSKKFIKILNEKVKLTEKLDTKSNLKYEVLQEILQIFEMGEEDIVEYKSKLNVLVNTRNSIAHGENSILIDLEKMSESIDLVVTLIDIILLKQTQFAQNENFYLHEPLYPN